MALITVTAKITAGYHPGLGKHIVKGETYEIEEEQFGDELFERPDPDWLSPLERAAKETAEKATAESEPAVEGQGESARKGGKK